MILCKASEVGKIVVNRCLDRGILINTQKLEKLLVLMQIECIKRLKKPLFTEEIVVWKCGVVIKEVDSDFMRYAICFDERQEEFITLLEKEEESVEYILKVYGHMDVFELNRLYVFKKLDPLSMERDGERYIPLICLQGKYLFD